MFTEEQILALLQSLVAIDSPYYQEQKILDFCAAWLTQRGFTVKRHTYREDKAVGFSGENVLVELNGAPGGPTVCLNGHVDTVPLCAGWTRNPHGELEGRRLYGLGAADMKGGVAALLLAIERFARERQDFAGKIILTLVSDEEGPFGLGANALIEEGLLDDVDCSLVTEPSSAFTGHSGPVIALGARGTFVYNVDFFGASAHASLPEQGLNAVVQAARFIAASEKLVLSPKGALGKGSFCVLKIAGDGGACSVPEFCRVTIHRHVPEGEDEAYVLREAEELCRRAGISCRTEIALRPYPSEGSRSYLPYVVASDNPFALALTQAVREAYGEEPQYDYFASIGDFNYLGTRLNGAPALVFGPDGGNFHQADEYVDIPSVARTTAAVYRFLELTML